MLENGRMANRMDKGLTHGLMEKNTLASGKNTKSMAAAPLRPDLEAKIVENGEKARFGVVSNIYQVEKLTELMY